jgi:hypothetical protein
VALPCRQDRGQRQALPVAREVDLRRESAPAVAERRAYARVFSIGPVPFLSSFGPPAAARAA